MLYVLFGILAGNALPLQTSVNAGMRRALKNPFLASLLSFIVTISTFVIALLLTQGRLTLPLGVLRDEPLWVWIPGFLGVFFLTGNIMLFPKLGGVKTIICTATGQVLVGMVIDGLGLFGAAVRPVSALRMLGAVLVLAGVVIVAMTRGGKNEGGLRSEDILWCFFGIFIGACSAVQTTINGYVGKMLGNAAKATLVSSTESLPWVLLLLFVSRKHMPIAAQGLKNTKPWMWLGGAFGAAYIFSNAWLSGVIGTGLAIVSTLIGSTLGGLIIDHFGLFEAKRQRLNAVKLVGILAMVGGSAMIRML